MASKSSPLFYMACFVLLFITLFPKASAQDNSCLNQLSPCLNYLNGNREPPSTCCDPLKSVIQSDPQCLCSLISNKGTRQAEQAGINVTQAQTLPGRCGQRVNPLACLSSMLASLIPLSSLYVLSGFVTLFSISWRVLFKRYVLLLFQVLLVPGILLRTQQLGLCASLWEFRFSWFWSLLLRCYGHRLEIAAAI